MNLKWHDDESGVELGLPDKDHFRFQDCEAYNKVKGMGIKEMDFCWWNQTKDSIYLLEALDTKKDSSQEILLKIVVKGLDSLLLLLAVWMDTRFGESLGSELPKSFPTAIPTKFIFIFILRTRSGHAVSSDKKGQFAPYQDKARSRLRSRLGLFSGNPRLVIDDKESIIRIALGDAVIR